MTILELKEMIEQIQNIKIPKITPQELPYHIQEMIGLTTKSTIQLKQASIERYCQNNNKCIKCDRIGQYIFKDTNSILCWKHSVE
jgi:hypothetical protein